MTFPNVVDDVWRHAQIESGTVDRSTNQATFIMVWSVSMVKATTTIIGPNFTGTYGDLAGTTEFGPIYMNKI